MTLSLNHPALEPMVAGPVLAAVCERLICDRLNPTLCGGEGRGLGSISPTPSRSTAFVDMLGGCPHVVVYIFGHGTVVCEGPSWAWMFRPPKLRDFRGRDAYNYTGV